MRVGIMAMGGLAVLMALSAVRPAAAQTKVFAQDASITAAGGTIVATRVPVQVGSGPVSYYDVTITITGKAVGSLPAGVTVAGTYASSQLLNSNNFSAGLYVDAAGNTFRVNGPGVGASGGATSWSLTPVATVGTCYLTGASWNTATGAANPEYARMNAAGITTAAFSFGLSAGLQGTCISTFGAGALIGVANTAGGLSLNSYTAFAGGDKNAPVGTMTLTPKGP